MAALSATRTKPGDEDDGDPSPPRPHSLPALHTAVTKISIGPPHAGSMNSGDCSDWEWEGLGGRRPYS